MATAAAPESPASLHRVGPKPPTNIEEEEEEVVAWTTGVSQ